MVNEGVNYFPLLSDSLLSFPREEKGWHGNPAMYKSTCWLLLDALSQASLQMAFIFVSDCESASSSTLFLRNRDVSGSFSDKNSTSIPVATFRAASIADPSPTQSAPKLIRPFRRPIFGVCSPAATAPASGAGPALMPGAPAPRCSQGLDLTSGLEYFSGKRVRL